MAKLKVALIYGGQSAEHEVSVHSAQGVGGILAKKYDVLNILITKDNRWLLQDRIGPAGQGGAEISPVVGKDKNLYTQDGQSFKADVFFPVLHGANGEDGAIQGLFEMLDAAYVGCGVLTSALAMDKELSKLLASFYGVPIVPYIKLDNSYNYSKEEVQGAVLQLGYPLFVKPVSLGSSIGVSKVKNSDELLEAVKKAFKYDSSILIEKSIENAREIFCAVVGYANTVHTSLCGELSNVKGEFFDYASKYEAAGGCDMKIPADIPQDLQDKLRVASHDIFKVLRGNGLARADFLLGESGDYYFSEINTMPGLSATSLYPNLWQSSRKTFDDILDILIHLALRRKMAKDNMSKERQP
jgi:D-alanine-D-alanine ligase